MSDEPNRHARRRVIVTVVVVAAAVVLALVVAQLGRNGTAAAPRGAIPVRLIGINDRDGVVSYGEAFAVQPFGNVMQVLTLTGDQLARVLEQQWAGGSPGTFLQVSGTLHYTWARTAPAGRRVSAITVAGVPVTPEGRYRVAVNNFLAAGGDRFTGFTEGTDVVGGPVDLDALVDYLRAHPGLAPPPPDRVTTVP